MTGADLSATSKPWNLQMRTVTTLYEEFYDQGDREMQSGRVPVPVMNRTYIDQQALHQVITIILDVHLSMFSMFGACSMIIPINGVLVAVFPCLDVFAGWCGEESGMEAYSSLW